MGRSEGENSTVQSRPKNSSWVASLGIQALSTRSSASWAALVPEGGSRPTPKLEAQALHWILYSGTFSFSWSNATFADSSACLAIEGLRWTILNCPKHTELTPRPAGPSGRRLPRQLDVGDPRSPASCHAESGYFLSTPTFQDGSCLPLNPSRPLPVGTKILQHTKNAQFSRPPPC